MSNNTANSSTEVVQDMCPYPYVDLHSHLQFEDFDGDRESIIAEMKEKNVITINIGTTLETSVAGLDLALRYSDTCYATLGLHPVYADESGLDELEKFSDTLKKTVQDEKSRTHMVGIGECGMDFFRVKKDDSKEDGILETGDNVENAEVKHFPIQEKVFERQIQLAQEYNLPLMIHVRDSYQKTLSILSKYFNTGEVKYRGNAHFFVGSMEEAQAFLDLGFSISFTGVITFVPVYEELVRFVPLERMFAETDSPYVSPKPYRGKKNTPVHVIEIYKKIAEIKGVSLSVVRETLYKNACRYWLKGRNIDNFDSYSPVR